MNKHLITDDLSDGFAAARAAFDAARFEEAIGLLTPMLATTEDWKPVALLAETFDKLGLQAEAAEVFELAAARPDAEMQYLLQRAACLQLACGRRDKAMSIAARLRRIDPQDEAAAAVLSATLPTAALQGRKIETVDDLIASNDPDRWLKAVSLIAEDQSDRRNLTLFKKLRKEFPSDPYIRAALAGFARYCCAYDVLSIEDAQLRADLAASDTSALEGETPYHNLLWCADERLNRLAANVTGVEPPAREAALTRLTMPHAWGDKLRIGYLSNDLWDDHATMRLFQSVLTAHDASRFDITLFCYTSARNIGFDGGGRGNWGKIVRIGTLSDQATANAIRAENIDILVDLKGHSADSRSRLMNRPLAPVHVAWLGFPGSVVNIDCDYVIGDPIVLPDSSRPHYHEHFCRLPETYQPNDPHRRPLPPPRSRAELGLPADATVFANFCSPRKNSLESMALWARVLDACPGTIFWMMVDGQDAQDATREHFTSLGIDGTRILFAPKMAYQSHLARAQAADLCLDTFPYNGHTTTSDMLWAGVPVVTKKGTNFASRVSESLLRAIGLPDLVAHDSDAFVDLCRTLSQDRGRIESLKARLAENRFTTPLFNAERFCRHLESAYETMADRAKAGLLAADFDVRGL